MHGGVHQQSAATATTPHYIVSQGPRDPVHPSENPVARSNF